MNYWGRSTTQISKMYAAFVILLVATATAREAVQGSLTIAAQLPMGSMYLVERLGGELCLFDAW